MTDFDIDSHFGTDEPGLVGNELGVIVEKDEHNGVYLEMTGGQMILNREDTLSLIETLQEAAKMLGWNEVQA